MSYYHKRQAIRLQDRAEGRAVAESMMSQDDDIPTPEQHAMLAKEAAAAARFRGCLTPAKTEAFATAFTKAFVARIRAAVAMADMVEG